ncbi:hypothetical protein F2Q69_00013202 [Brassica cretica]|uniref:Uncharacterized protein n=1 Tax=Brassica cretica TaxID=69181 RepID=A0A8S9R973_BRACR|nr:hypothetical protein F2Q69_00013202 [Brassica cretica]
MDREARGGSIYEIRTWWQLPGMTCGARGGSAKARGVAMHATRPCGQTCGGRGVSLHGARPCTQTGRDRGVTLHVSRSCNQPCGARGVAAHASRAMRSDTRAATRLVSDWLLITINIPRPPPISPHPEHIKVPVTWKLDHGRRPGLTE